MKKLISALIFLFGIIFQGSASKAPVKQVSIHGDKAMDYPSKQNLQKEKDQKKVERRLKGLGYFD
ncbi:MAG: hypothetical protein D6814_09000 [Calditrichaeota bacterium]|nr:MAG: hypothetical protein D6814_09000 [Calditrichota bacterium]